MMYNIVSARPENFGELYGQLEVHSKGLRCSSTHVPTEFRGRFEELIEESEEWTKTVYGGNSTDDVADSASDSEFDLVSPCGGIGTERLTETERLERLVRVIPERFPVAVERVDQG